MATSVDDYIAKRKKELGFTQPVDSGRSRVDSYIESRKMDLGIIPDTRPKPYTPTPMPIRPMTSQTDFKKLGEDMRADAFVEQGKATRAAQDPANKTLAAVKHATVDKIGEGVDRFLAGDTGFKPADRVGRFVNQFSQGGGAAVGVDTQAAGAAPLASTGSKIADKTAQIAGGIAGFAVNPAQVESNLLTAPYRAAEGALVSRVGVGASRIAQRTLTQEAANAGVHISPRVGATIAQRGLAGAAAGAVQGAVNSGVRGETDVKDVARSAAIGAALGGAGDAAIGGAVQGLRGRFAKPAAPAAPEAQPLALPLGRADVARQRSVNPPGTEPIVNPYTFALPEAQPGTVHAESNVADARKALTDIDNQARQLTSQYEQRVNQEYQYLKQSMQDRGGVQQGSLQRTTEGVVAGRSGRISNNPLWYQEAFRAKGGRPSNKDLYELARKRVDEGFKDEQGEVPSWREETGYDQTLSSLQAAREQVANSLRELDPALKVTPEPIVGQTLRNVRRAGEVKPVRPLAPPEQPASSIPTARTFKTSKGSSYKVDANGSTTRTKSIHQGHLTSDVGEKAPSQRTVYVDKALASEIGSHASLNSEARPRIAIRDDGLYLISHNPKTGQWGRHGNKIPYTTEPEIGKAPIEFWNIREEPGAGVSASRVHAGNEIVEVGHGAPEEPLTPRPMPQQPSSQSLGISAFGGKAKPYDNLSTSTKSQLVTRQTKERPPLKTLKNKIYTSLVDDLDPLNRFDKEVERLIDKPLQPAQRSHTLALNSRGSDIIAKTILTENQVDAAGNVIGKSLKGILKDLPKNEHSYVDFEDYLVNKHAITRMRERGERVYRKELNWTPEQGEQIVADYDAAYPQFATMADELYQYQRNMVQHWLVDTGMIPQERADAYFKANPTYVPNKRFFSELESAGGSKGGKSKRGIGNQSAPIKKYVPGGSERKIISPIEAIIENTDAFVKAARRNQAMQAFARNLERDPEALQAFGEFVPEEQIAGAQSLKELNKTLNEEGIEGVIAKLGEDFDINFRKATQRGLDKDNIIRVMVDGEPKYIQVNDKPTLEAITAMGPDGANAVMDFLGKVTSVFKTLTTGVNPVFSLTRNIMRDIPQAYAASKTTNNPFQFFGDLAASAWAIARNKELYQQYKAIGGGHSSPAAADRNLLKRSKDQVLPPDRNPVRGALPRGYRKLQEIMDAWETAPRLGEFKRLAASGTNADRQAGLAAAQDVTVNFKRRGRLGKQLDKVFPYFNAAVQGLDKTNRMFRDNWLKTSAKTALAVSLPAMISYAINWDNPNYQKVSKRTKDNFYLLPLPNGTFAKIAKPKEIGTIFADIPERLLQAFAKQDPDAFRDFASQVRTTFTPPGVQGALKSGGIPDKILGAFGDTVIGPGVDVVANKNFAGAAIVPGYLKNLSPELQSDPRTSIVANKVGEWTGSSPKALDYLFRQYTGILGQLGQPLLSPGGSVGSALAQQVTADPVYSNDISEKFYESMGHQDQAKSDYNVTGELPADYNDGLRRYLDKLSDAMGSIRKQMRAIEKDGSIPAGQKRDQLRTLQEQINQLAGQGNTAAASTK